MGIPRRLMDYSNLVEALRNHDYESANRILEEIRPRLIRFLEIHMNATYEDARDCTQESLVASLDAVHEDRIQKPNKLFSYLLTTCRNQYLKLLEKRREEHYDRIPDSSHHAPRQLADLMDKEQQQILKECLNALKKEHREFIDYWFEYPDTDAQTVADHFGISINNAWTRKHRIIKRLNRCYQKKINS